MKKKSEIEFNDTKNIVDKAIEKNVSTFVFVSTDKAVNPSNIMGATKRVAEMYVSVISSENKTKIITTRFGNVLGLSLIHI